MTNENWDKYKKYLIDNREIGLSIDVSRVNFPEDLVDSHRDLIEQAFDSMTALEKGAIANPDEDRMVGHYWLRNSELAPTLEIQNEIEDALKEIKAFVGDLHDGTVATPSGEKFDAVLVIGIGGSALGPQFVSRALATSNDKLDVYFIDNTDPDGVALTLASIKDLSRTLVLVISKSGGTPETRNGMLLARSVWEKQGLDFTRSAIAITGSGSKLFQLADQEQWLKIFPMWDWVGGRTSELSAVGLLPAALQGIDIDALLEGARLMDSVTRVREVCSNPACMLALMWYHIGDGAGKKDMVILPYKDRLELFSRYLQQLVMESLGKGEDLDGGSVEQGIAVYGNKGSTDQHAYIQQLRDGLNNFFVTFIEVLSGRSACASEEAASLFALEVEEGVTSTDYLSGFFQGTRTALFESGRESITISIDVLSEKTVGALIALFERAVGYYASFVNINAYHQPGVEAGKKAAGVVLDLQREVLNFLDGSEGSFAAEDLAVAIGRDAEVETVFMILRNLEANGRVAGIAGERTVDMQFERLS